jgi:hypothetical protein
MTDEQIAPILSAERYAKGNKITSGLASFAKKSSKTSEKLAQSRLGLGDAFDTLSKKALNVGAGNDIAKATLIENINSTLGKLPANVGNVIRNDLSVLANSERTASDAITFWRAINHEAVGRNKGLSKLKGPVGDYLAKLDGNLYSEFKLTNDLYGKFAKFQKALLPPKDPGLLESGKPLAYIYGITTGNLPLLGELIGFSKTKQLATSMLTNPRYQNLSGQMISAIKSNSPAALRQVVNGFTKQLTKDGQIELVRQLNLLSDDDLLEILQAD